MKIQSTMVGLKRYEGVKTILLQSSPETLFRPHVLERSFILMMLPMFALGCVILAVTAMSMGNATWFERYQLIPMGALFLAMLIWALRSKPGGTATIRLATLLIGTFAAMERLFVGMWITVREGLEPDYLTGLTPWMILASCLFVFLLNKRGLLAGFAYYTLGVVGISLFMLVNPHHLPEALAQDLTVNYMFATPIFLMMMAGLSRLRLAYGTALSKAEDFEDLAMQDQLTGLFNRRAFSVCMRRARARQARKGTPVCMIMCDLDHFKRINDTYGHSKGDEVLVAFSEILTKTMRRTDDVIRWGGEEFMILMEETKLSDACMVAERLRALTEECKAIRGGFTASFGVTELYKGEQDTEFFNRADLALYDAKEHGRNMVVMRRRRKSPSNPQAHVVAELIDEPDIRLS